jgi:hypothetical protein
MSVHGAKNHEKSHPEGWLFQSDESGEAQDLTLASAALNVALGRMMAASLAWSGM